MSKITEEKWEVVGPDDEPYGDIKIVDQYNSTVCRFGQDDAPVHDFNEKQWKRARIIGIFPQLLKALKMLIDANSEPKASVRETMRADAVEIVNVALDRMNGASR